MRCQAGAQAHSRARSTPASSPSHASVLAITQHRLRGSANVQSGPRRVAVAPTALAAAQCGMAAASMSSSSSKRQGVVCQAQSGSKKPIQQMLVYVPPHPLVKHWLAILRNAATPNAMFRAACGELGRLLIYEAVRELLPTVDAVLDTPMGPSEVTFVDPTKPIKVVPVLRAGLVLLEQAHQVLPAHETYHVGYVRNEETLQATSYLNKLPSKFEADDCILITDPMLATGGTILQVVDDIVARGAKPENIRIIAVVVAPPAMVKLSEKYKGIKVYTACIDAEVNEHGFIVPGLGDAGDRAFGTTK